MENKIDLAVNEAKKYLKHPRDVTHDIAHHENVWKNCMEIIKHENLKVDPDLVKVSAFWHDVVLGKEGIVSSDNVKENVRYLKSFLPKVGFNEKEINIISESVLRHEFRDDPVNIEGMVLQDADKLDVLSKERWDRTLKAYKTGEMTKERYISYSKTGLKWITILESTFHFKYSKIRAHGSIKNIYENEEQIKAFKEIGLEKDLADSIEAMNSFQTKIKRLLISLNNRKIEFLIDLKSIFL